LQPLWSPWRQRHTGTVPRWHQRSLGRRSSRPGPTIPAMKTHVRWKSTSHTPAPCRSRHLTADTCLDQILLKTGAESVLQAPPEQTPPSLWSQLRPQQMPRLFWRQHWRRGSALLSLSSPDVGEAHVPSLSLPISCLNSTSLSPSWVFILSRR
jgi:hypothetical protein